MIDPITEKEITEETSAKPARLTADNVILRPAHFDDWIAIRLLLAELTHETPPVALTLDSLFRTADQWIKHFPAGNMGTFTVAVDQNNDLIVGFCYLARPKARYAVANLGIAIKKDYREFNIGSRMLYHAFEWAAQAEIRFIVAETWTWNATALAFFESFGFEETGRVQKMFKGEEKERIQLIKEM